MLTEEGTELQDSSLSLIEYIIKLDLLLKTSFLIKPFDKHNPELMGSFALPRAYAFLLIRLVPEKVPALNHNIYKHAHNNKSNRKMFYH